MPRHHPSRLASSRPLTASSLLKHSLLFTSYLNSTSSFQGLSSPFISLNLADRSRSSSYHFGSAFQASRGHRQLHSFSDHTTLSHPVQDLSLPDNTKSIELWGSHPRDVRHAETFTACSPSLSQIRSASGRLAFGTSGSLKWHLLVA